MNERMEFKPLTPEQKMLVYGVVETRYKGDEEKYLSDMIWWYGIQLD